MLVLAQHTIDDPGRFWPTFNKALMKLPSGIRLRDRFIARDGSKGVFVWSALSLEAVEDFTRGLGITELGRFHLMEIFGPPPAPPYIASVFPFSVIKPGGGVIIQGTDFGAEPGQFRLEGTFPGGFLELSGLQWGDTFASGVIPMVTGVQDQAAVLTIVRQDGVESNRMPVDFTANRELRLLPMSVFLCRACGSDNSGANVDWCSDGAPYFTMSASHFKADPFSGSGTDEWYCLLRNGWVYDHYEWGMEEGIFGSPFGLGSEPVATAQIDLQITWSYDILSSANYELAVYAVGPIGVPFQ